MATFEYMQEQGKGKGLGTSHIFWFAFLIKKVGKQ